MLQIIYYTNYVLLILLNLLTILFTALFYILCLYLLLPSFHFRLSCYMFLRFVCTLANGERHRKAFTKMQAQSNSMCIVHNIFSGKLPKVSQNHIATWAVRNWSNIALLARSEFKCHSNMQI